MKKFLILAAATVAFASCSKNYTCKCNNPTTGEENSMVYQSDQKSHAERLCRDWEARVVAGVPDNIKTTCSIK